MITEQLLNRVIEAPKIAIKAKSKKMVLINRNHSNTIYLKSDDSEYGYRLVLRQSDTFIEDFSVALIWDNANTVSDINKDIILVRYQGPHDGKVPVGTDEHHSYHIHRITLEDIKEKRFNKPSNRQYTNRYASFEQAIKRFEMDFSITGIENVVEPFWKNSQLPGQMSVEDYLHD
jgi:hypothetical protein